MHNPERAKEVVTLGAADLDQHLPNWYVLINKEILDLESCEDCILGQLNEHLPTVFPTEHVLEELAALRREGDVYGEALCKLDMTGDDDRMYGFNRYGYDDPTWDDLKEAWLEAIESRLHASVD